MPIIRLLRLDKPIPIFLLFYPCFFGLFLSSEYHNHWNLILIFLTGALIMRSAGCIINDLLDQNFDRQVTRTKNRPLASGDLSNLDAIIILLTLLFCGLLILLSLTKESILIGFCSIILVIIYPLLKRFTYFPQILLGILWNIGILIAHFNISKNLNKEILIAYIGCVFWTIGYDIIYAFTDIVDDKKIGIKSMAIFLQDKNPKFWLLGFYTIFILCMIVATFYARKLDFTIIICYIIAYVLLCIQVKKVKILGDISNILLFQSNFLVGFVISIGSVLQNI